MVEIVSGGTFCLPATILREHGYRQASMPFDWLFCSVDSLIKILQSEFAYFLDEGAITSGTIRNARRSASNMHYDGGNLDRPLFNHKDPTSTEDKNYYLRCIERFKAARQSTPVLLVVEEFGEIDVRFHDLIQTVDKHFPEYSVYAVRHETGSLSRPLLEPRVQVGHHRLMRFTASQIISGTNFLCKTDASTLLSDLIMNMPPNQ